jgi:transcriptional regulator with XRE-family HTH domain
MPHVHLTDHLVATYVRGRLTLSALAEHLGASEPAVREALHARGVLTSTSRTKREQFARQLEAAEHLPDGSCYAIIGELYRGGLSLCAIAGKLHLASRAVALILFRCGVPLRPAWFRSVFRDQAGRPLDHRPFGERLRQLRQERELSQEALGERCERCQQAISKLEKGKNGPHWDTALRIAAALGVGLDALGITWEPPWQEAEAGPEPALALAAEPLEFVYGFDSVGLIVDVSGCRTNFTYDPGPWPPPTPALALGRD